MVIDSNKEKLQAALKKKTSYSSWSTDRLWRYVAYLKFNKKNYKKKN